jgi:predicted SAM-dependent methyltransferase
MRFTAVEQAEIKRLSEAVNFSNIADPNNVAILGHLSRKEREEFALKTRSLVLYFGAEVAACQQAEEAAALAARPKGYQLEDLNGLNVGCGDRSVSPYLSPIDIMRAPPRRTLGGEHHAFTSGALLALPDELPFRPGTIDYIVSLHLLEHVTDPVSVVLHWLNILKPGGGLGIVVPDWRYTWDARYDTAPYGHKWNPTPELLKRMYNRHWSSAGILEASETYDFKLSFDFILRKRGDFVPFSRQRLESALFAFKPVENRTFLE